jgi:hypothetical protein
MPSASIATITMFSRCNSNLFDIPRADDNLQRSKKKSSTRVTNQQLVESHGEIGVHDQLCGRYCHRVAIFRRQEHARGRHKLQLRAAQRWQGGTGDVATPGGCGSRRGQEPVEVEHGQRKHLVCAPFDLAYLYYNRRKQPTDQQSTGKSEMKYSAGHCV